MSSREDPTTGFTEAAQTLEECFDEIFEDYKRRLREIGSLMIVGDGTSPAQLEANARDILERTAKVLRDGEQG